MNGSPPNVLVIDDDNGMRDLVCEMLKNVGCDAESAVNGREGLAKFEVGGFQAVITDLWMPVMDGVATIIAIRKTDKTVPIIVMTGIDDKDRLVGAATQQGASRILRKPFSLANLRDALGFLGVLGETKG